MSFCSFFAVFHKIVFFLVQKLQQIYEKYFIMNVHRRTDLNVCSLSCQYFSVGKKPSLKNILDVPENLLVCMPYEDLQKYGMLL
jgi:hypothetical protein